MKSAFSIGMFTLISLGCSIAFVTTNAADFACEIRGNGIGGSNIGDSYDNVKSRLEGTFRLRELKETQSVRTLEAWADDALVLRFSFSDTDKAILIGAYSSCRTAKGIGPGSRLAEAVAAYGSAQVVPSDSGYQVFFKKLTGIAFLLDDASLPPELRGVADDVFNRATERKILRLGKTPIKAVQVYWQSE